MPASKNCVPFRKKQINSSKKTVKQLEKTDRRFNTQWGRLVESLVEGSLYAERKGLFVIRATGDSASIVNKEDYKPKAFPSQGSGG